MKYDVIIIGAGAAGLMAMKELVARGYHVCLLEAADKAGGRIATVNENSFEFPLEPGAEFIHGKMPLTLKLLKKAAVEYEPVGGEMFRVKNGKWIENEHPKGWKKFSRKTRKLKNDITIQQFFDEQLNKRKFETLREGIKNFAEGFDLADISEASVISIKEDFKHIDETQYRVKGGYIQLINYLLKKCKHPNAVIHYRSCVEKIEYEKRNAVVHINNGKEFTASFVIVTVSPGILKAGSIKFDPALENHAEAINSIGFGSVIKFLLWFKSPFWKKYGNDIGFLLTNEEIPTWWTQLPVENNLLTGWLGGPRANESSGQTNDELLQKALLSLSAIFHTPVDELKQGLIYHKIICWSNQPYIKGGYSYTTLNSAKAIRVLSKPAYETIFFAGEAYEEKLPGTVESALQSGRKTAKKLIKEFL